MFGCYRRSDAADPETYVAAVAMVLAHFPADVVKAVTDPYGGLPSRKTERGYSGLPDVADVKLACTEEAAAQERRALLAKVRPVSLDRRLPRPPAAPGAWANVYVPETDWRYQALIERARTEDARCWRRDEALRLWVSLNWLHDAERVGTAKRFNLTDEDLRRMYPPREASAPEVAA